tara:strand:- start:72427 stop:72759 length:333 start_codon:yes stop_codon:yes gene_type:complete
MINDNTIEKIAESIKKEASKWVFTDTQYYYHHDDNLTVIDIPDDLFVSYGVYSKQNYTISSPLFGLHKTTKHQEELIKDAYNYAIGRTKKQEQRFEDMWSSHVIASEDKS